MGVLPPLFQDAVDRKSPGIVGDATLPVWIRLRRMDRSPVINRANGTVDTVLVIRRIETGDEVANHQHDGILQYVLRGMAKAA
jgi:aconitate hydratase